MGAFADVPEEEPTNSYDINRSFENAGVIYPGVQEEIAFNDSFETCYTADFSEGRYRLYYYGEYGNNSNDSFWVGIYASEDEAVKGENVLSSETGLVNNDNADADYEEFEFKDGTYYIVIEAFCSDNRNITLEFVELDENGYEIYDDEGDAPVDESDMDVPISNWLTDAEITGFRKSLTYTGKAVKQDLTIKIKTTQGVYRTITANEDYKITYKNNKDVVLATMTITGLEYFKNSPKITRKFKVIPKGSSITGLSTMRLGNKQEYPLNGNGSLLR